MLTQEQWYQKLKSWVPRWFFEQEKNNVAIFKAIAKILSELESSADQHFAETFLLQATGATLDAHGDERNITRITGEPDHTYAVRIQQIANNSNRPDIKRLVDDLLIVGESIIIEHEMEGPFCNRETYCNRRQLLNDHRYHNYFTVLLPRQIVPSNSFLNRETYADRGHYLGTLGTLPVELILSIINAVVNKARAAGVMYRILEQ